MKITFTILIGILFLNTGFAQHKEFKWLIGVWKIKDKNVFEVWHLTTETQNLSGRAFHLKEADTVLTEVISLEFYNQSFHYIPDVAGDQGPIDFKITSFDDQGFVAENLQHDFPKLIRYRLVRKNDREFLEAAIEGNGKVIPYTFERVK